MSKKSRIVLYIAFYLSKLLIHRKAIYVKKNLCLFVFVKVKFNINTRNALWTTEKKKEF